MKKNKIEDTEFIPIENSSLAMKTFDLGASAAMLCAGFELLSLDRVNPHKVMFVFRREEGIENAIDSYWSDRLEVKARSFFDAIKALKNRLYSE